MTKQRKAAKTAVPLYVWPKPGEVIKLKRGQKLDPEYLRRCQASWQKTLDSGQAVGMSIAGLSAMLQGKSIEVLRRMGWSGAQRPDGNATEGGSSSPAIEPKE